MSDLQEYYNRSAGKIADEWYPNEILIPTHRDFLSLLPDKPTILDFGCGPGYESKRLHALGANVVGIDFSAVSIDIARKKNPDSAFYKMDFYHMDPSIGHFDGVLASGSLIHVPPGKLPSVLANIRDLLVKDGVLAALIRDGNGKRTQRRIVDGKELDWAAYSYTEEDFSQYCTQVQSVRVCDPVRHLN